MPAAARPAASARAASRRRWSSSQLALTLVLLTGAGLMVRSFLELYRLDFGIDTAHLVSMRMNAGDAEVSRHRVAPALLRTGERRVRARARRRARPRSRARCLAPASPSATSRSRAGRYRVASRGHAPASSGSATATSRRSGFCCAGAARSRSVTVCPASKRRSSTSTSSRTSSPTTIRSAAASGCLGEKGQFTPWLTIVGISPTVLQGDIRDAEPQAIVYTAVPAGPRHYATIIGRADGDPADARRPAAAGRPERRRRSAGLRRADVRDVPGARCAGPIACSARCSRSSR